MHFLRAKQKMYISFVKNEKQLQKERDSAVQEVRTIQEVVTDKNKQIQELEQELEDSINENMYIHSLECFYCVVRCMKQ